MQNRLSRRYYRRERTIACAQFGSGIVFDPTQSGHAIQQIAAGEPTVYDDGGDDSECDRRLQPGPGMASSAADALHVLQQSRSSGMDCLTRPANTYGNSLPWMNAATTGYGASPRIRTASLPRLGRCPVFPLSAPRAAGNCGTRSDGRSFRRSQREQFTDGRNDSCECSPA